MATRQNFLERKSAHSGISFPLFIPLALLACLLVLPSCTNTKPFDYKIYQNMGAFMKAKLIDAGATERTDMPDKFKPGVTYKKNLSLLLALIFGSPDLRVYLQSYESDRIAVSSISQFEAPPGSDNYTDCAFVVRPTAKIAAPFMHGDKRAPMAGSSDDLSMDFYTYDKDRIADMDAYVDNFFGAEKAKLIAGMALVAQYQKILPDRGKYTPYLDPYKSKYRLELALPKNSDEAARKAYFDAVLQAFKLYQDAYFAALANAESTSDEATIDARATAAGAFIELIKAKDAAYSLGKMLFGEEDIPLYFEQGFWREGFYGAE
jgi:hypothetical protein